jgi:hypothetical protein
MAWAWICVSLKTAACRSSFGLASGLFCIQPVKCHKQDDRSQGEMKQPDCRCVNRYLKKEKKPASTYFYHILITIAAE